MRASKKLKRKEKELVRAGKDPRAEENIYDDIGDYVPTENLAGMNRQNTKPDYFDATSQPAEADFNKKDVNVKDFVKNVTEKFGSKPATTWDEARSNSQKKEKSLKTKTKKITINIWKTKKPCQKLPFSLVSRCMRGERLGVDLVSCRKNRS